MLLDRENILLGEFAEQAVGSLIEGHGKVPPGSASGAAMQRFFWSEEEGEDIAAPGPESKGGAPGGGEAKGGHGGGGGGGGIFGAWDMYKGFESKIEGMKGGGGAGGGGPKQPYEAPPSTGGDTYTAKLGPGYKEEKTA